MIRPAWRGVVYDGQVWAWPTLLMTHNEAFTVIPQLRNYTARFRQWEAGEPVDFDKDPPASAADRALVEEFIKGRN